MYPLLTGDLWGPLIVCLLLSCILSITAPGDSGSFVFAAVFVIVWTGAAIVTLNAQLLGIEESIWPMNLIQCNCSGYRGHNLVLPVSLHSGLLCLSSHPSCPRLSHHELHLQTSIFAISTHLHLIIDSLDYHQEPSGRNWLHMEYSRYCTKPTSFTSLKLIFSFAASVVFMTQVIKEERRALAAYPVFFFYTFISWLILLQ